MTDAPRTIWVGRHGTSDWFTGCIKRTMTMPEPYHHDAVVRELVEAAQALGAMPEGYCFCSANRIGDNSKDHEPECADLRTALAKIDQQ